MTRRYFPFQYEVQENILTETYEEALRLAMQEANRIDGESPGNFRIVVREADADGSSSLGVYCEGCENEIFPGIRWPTRANDDGSHQWVERCDSCERFDSDEEAAEWLVETYGPDTASIGHAVPSGCSGPHPYVVTR